MSLSSGEGGLSILKQSFWRGPWPPSVDLVNPSTASFKYITDGADEQANEDWEANLASGIVEFKEKVLRKLNESIG